MRIGSGEHTYEWISDWARIPDTEGVRAGWAHHGVVVTEAQEVIAYHPGEPTVLVFDKEGNLQRSWGTELTESHGMSLARDSQGEYLWIADPGAKRTREAGYEYRPTNLTERRGQVVKMTLDGQTVMNIQRPDLAIYLTGSYSPTSVTVYQERHGGNGDIWVADGYGESYVHRYSKAGDYIGSINGEEGEAGRFDCPHSVWVDTRKSEPELYVADRGNRRVQVYDLEGEFKRAFGSDFLSSPSAFVAHGDFLVIAELRARLAVLDQHDHLVGYLGDNEDVCQVDGWPNNKNEKGEVVPTQLLRPGKFNSPHGVAADTEGNLYVVEWLIGGRYTKLARR